MVSNKALSAAAVALIASTLVSAQTSTSCNPLKQSCPADKAFGNDKVDCDMTKCLCSAFHTLSGTKLDFGSQGAVFSISTYKDAPTIQTGDYIFFGKVEADIQAAPEQGIVTSAVLQSDDLDEIDWEWVGGDNSHVQTNYYSQGNTETYDRGKYHPVGNPTGSVHTYSIEWTAKTLTWSIDGKVVRTLQNTGATGPDAYPQTPMQIKLGTWVAGRPDGPAGTTQWAGGVADLSKGPFKAYYNNIKITDYAGGSSAATGSIKEYRYSGSTGLWTSIKVVKGDGSSSSGSGSDSDSSSSSSSHAKTSSKASGSSESTATSDVSSATSAAQTTVTTATGGGASNATANGGSSTGTPTGTGAPSSSTGNAAVQNVARFGGIALAGAGAYLAQLLL